MRELSTDQQRRIMLNIHYLQEEITGISDDNWTDNEALKARIRHKIAENKRRIKVLLEVLADSVDENELYNLLTTKNMKPEIIKSLLGDIEGHTAQIRLKLIDSNPDLLSLRNFCDCIIEAAQTIKAEASDPVINWMYVPIPTHPHQLTEFEKTVLQKIAKYVGEIPDSKIPDPHSLHTMIQTIINYNVANSESERVTFGSEWICSNTSLISIKTHTGAEIARIVKEAVK